MKTPKPKKIASAKNSLDKELYNSYLNTVSNLNNNPDHYKHQKNYKKNLKEFSSIKPFVENFSLEFRRNIKGVFMNDFNPNSWKKEKKKHNNYITEIIAEDFNLTTSPNLDKSHIDRFRLWALRCVNLMIKGAIDGKLIPQNGTHIDIVSLKQKTFKEDLSKPTVFINPNDGMTQFYQRFLTSFPGEEDEESSLRGWRGIKNKNFKDEFIWTTFVYRIPFKFLSSKVRNIKTQPKKGDFWVYRLRFFINDTDTLDQDTIDVYQNGYVGVTSRTPFHRFDEHHRGYVQKSKKSLYNSWSFLDERKIEHVISFEILDRCDSRQEMFQLEQQYINELNTLKKGFNSIPGGEHGERFLKAVGIECDDLENKDDYAARLHNKSARSRKPHYVREHLRQFKPSSFTLVSGHYRNLPKEAEELLI